VLGKPKTHSGVYNLSLELGSMWTCTDGPVIDVASELVYTGPGQSATIECVVESDPEASSMWYHNSSVTAIDFIRRPNIDSSLYFHSCH